MSYLKQDEFVVVEREELPAIQRGPKSRQQAFFAAVLAGKAVFLPVPEEELALRREAIKNTLHRRQRSQGDTRVLHVVRDKRKGLTGLYVTGLYVWLDGERSR